MKLSKNNLANGLALATAILIVAIIVDVVVLGAFLIIKAQSDMLIIYLSVIVMFAVFGGEKLFLKTKTRASNNAH